MNKRIIYQNDNGGVSIIIPADCGLTVEQIAAKDVPLTCQKSQQTALNATGGRLT